MVLKPDVCHPKSVLIYHRFNKQIINSEYGKSTI